MYQKIDNVLAVAFTCAADTLAVGDVVEISADNTVVKRTLASTKVVGTVAAAFGTGCTINTRFRERRDDRVAGAAVAVGPFVWDADGKAIAFASETHSVAAIAGLVIVSASAEDDAIETLEY